LFAALGISDEGPFTRAFSYSNEVWLGPSVVLRLTPPERSWASAQEQDLLYRLPDAVPHPDVLGSGTYRDRPWLLLRRMPGITLMKAWPALSVADRRSVIHQLGQAMRALHHVPMPAHWQRADLRPDALSALAEPLDVAAPYQQPPERVHALARAARAVPGLDHSLVDAAEAFVAERLPLFSADRHVLVHTDLFGQNLLVEGGRLTAVLDFEMARLAASDLELDVPLRFCNWPHLPVPEEDEDLMRPEEFLRVPTWLAEVYPELFAMPRLRERMQVYAVMHDLRQSIQFPERPGDPAWKPAQRLRAIIRGRSYLRHLLPR
jgi:aminoglycoside phosphotransferase (APT) family kinase protein